MTGQPNGAARVRVPCSTANLGSGYDCIGVALERCLDATATYDGGDHATPRLERAGTLTALEPDATGPVAVDANGHAAADDDLIIRAFALACAAAGRPVPHGVTIRATSVIPVARGLGSSAAALVAGAMLADALLGLSLGRHRIAALCSTAEGHPDNVAPMVFGGAVLGIPRGDDWHFASLALHEQVGFALAIPVVPASTRDMRAALPREAPHRDLVVAAAKSAALVQGLATADPVLLAYALDDVIHVPYRRALIPAYDAVVSAACSAGAWGATLSGAGSTLLALAPRELAPRVAATMAERWRAVGMEAEGMVGLPAAGAVASGGPD